MNGPTETLVRELDESRRAMLKNKELLKKEANPVRRIRRSWTNHKTIWIASGVAVAGALALLLRRRGKTQPIVPPGYVVVAPAPPSSVWGTVFKVALAAARPAMEIWARTRKHETSEHRGNGHR